MRRLVLWDIDGTLISTDGIAAEEMRAAMARIVGPLGPLGREAFSGKTDWQIIAESFPGMSFDDAKAHLDRFSESYVTALRGRRGDLAARAKALPGAREALQALQERAFHAPLTGNIAPIARLKLEILSLDHLLVLEGGAYGDDHYDRAELVVIAANRATVLTGHHYRPTEIVVVGDTPNDIRCAHANGARAVAVASGRYSREELAEHAPDALFDDLTDLAAVSAAILA